MFQEKKLKKSIELLEHENDMLREKLSYYKEMVLLYNEYNRILSTIIANYQAGRMHFPIAWFTNQLHSVWYVKKHMAELKEMFDSLKNDLIKIYNVLVEVEEKQKQEITKIKNDLHFEKQIEEVPYSNVTIANADGTVNSKADTELFTHEVNEECIEISSTKDAKKQFEKQIGNSFTDVFEQEFHINYPWQDEEKKEKDIMKERYYLTKEVREKFKPFLIGYLNYLEKLSFEQVQTIDVQKLRLDFYQKGITPKQLQALLEELGYEESDIDTYDSGLGFKIYLERKDGKCFASGCEEMIIEGHGGTFELMLYINDSLYYNTLRF